MKLIGKNKEEVNVYCLDYYSIGHIIFGYTSFIICYLITLFLNTISPKEWALISTIIIGITWELFENEILAKTKLKFACRKDTILNSHSDVLFVFLGGLIGLTLSYFVNPVIFIITTIIILAGGVLAFEICSTLTIGKK